MLIIKPFVLGIILGILCLLLFVLFIKRFAPKVSAKDDKESNVNTEVVLYYDKSLTHMAASYIALLGSKENIEDIKLCTTCITFILKDNKNISNKQIKAIGAEEVIKLDNKTIQIVVGNKAEFIVDEIKELLK